MKCPTCNETMMVVTGRSEVEIDCCPNCRGVWLDRGELDALIETDGRRDEMALLRHCGRYPGRRRLLRDILQFE